MDVLGALERLHSLLDTFPTEDAHHPAVQVLHLAQYLAVFLAETIGLLQRVLTHPARGLVDETNAALLTEVLGPGHLHRVVMCLQQAQGRAGKAETAHWLSEGSLSPV